MPITNIVPLFPKHLFIAKIDIDNQKIVKDLESKFLDQKFYNSQDRFYNTESNLHECEIYTELCEEVLKLVKTINTDIFCYVECTPVISQMWATGCNKNSSIHKHYHPNSFFSGVYYPQAINYSPLRFYTPYKNQIVPKKATSNPHNAFIMPFYPEQGNLVLFPSDLEHDTESNTTDQIRLSVAFNIFLKGNLGENILHTGLSI